MTSGVPKLRILKLGQVAEKIGMSRTWIEQHYRAGQFPKPIVLGPGTHRGWIEHEVEAWIRQRVRERDAAAQPQGEAQSAMAEVATPENLPG